VAALGMQAEFERMLEYARQVLLGLQRIDVVLEPPYDTGDDDCVLLQALHGPVSETDWDVAWKKWGKWFVNAFPPDVVRHFCLVYLSGDNHGG
jgi:hypothetical protein